jgi:proliferating cell nuclear antigen
VVKLIELKKIDFFSRVLGAISTFVPEGNFRFSDKGVSFKAIDPSQVVLVDYFVDKKVFDKYVVEPNFVGIDLVEFNRIIQRASPNDKMLLDVSDAEMKIIFESELKRSFRLPLIDVSEQEAKTPSVEYETQIEIKAIALKEMLRDAGLFGSSVVLKIKGKDFFVEARGSQGTMESDAGKVSKVVAKKDVTAKFSLNFFQNIVKEADNEKNILIELKNDSPMKVSFSIGESKIVFYLAHMIL